MAIIKYLECGKIVIDMASNCPHCTYKTTNKIGYTEYNFYYCNVDRRVII